MEALAAVEWYGIPVLTGKWVRYLSVCGVCWVLAGCTPVGDAWLKTSTAAAANDQIMLVRKDPPSLGFVRLVTQTSTYPDLGVFLEQKGMPGFLAETNNQNRRYLILYYLEKRQAFACRTLSPRSSDVQFAGPYPITDREYRTLDGFRRAAENARPGR